VSNSLVAVWKRLIEEFVQSELYIKLLATLLFLGIVYVLKRLGVWVSYRLRNWWISRKKLLAHIAALETRLNRGLEAVAQINHGTHVSEGRGVWLTRPIRPPWTNEQYRIKLIDSIPIWVFANNKGGVAKTTNACNLAAHYAVEAGNNGKPVLLLDMDYQGSASSMSARDSVRIPPENHDSRSTKLIGGEITASDLLSATAVQHPDMIDDLSLRVVTAYYDLAQAENRLLIEWLFGEGTCDVRYGLAEVLHHPIVQSNFSRVIIDAPPRLTTACVQALCASTHVIIPTVLDRLSGEAVGAFLQQVETLKSANVCPYLEYAGIVGYRSGQATKHVSDAEDSIRDALRLYDLHEELYLSKAVIVHNPLLAEFAGQLIGYAKRGPMNQVSNVRSMIGNLAIEIERSIQRCKRGSQKLR
jgi:chromosome partitioning protein